MEKELQSKLIAGDRVHFVYLDPAGDRSKDAQFTARCNFLPSIGDRVIFGISKQEVFVKSIFHSFLQTDGFEEGIFFQVVNVVLTSHTALQDRESRTQ